MPFDRARYVRSLPCLLVGLALATGLSSAPVQAQSCDGQVTGSVAVADGSTSPTGQASAWYVGTNNQTWPGPLPGSITIIGFLGVPPPGQGSSTYTFEGSASFYFNEAGGSATCFKDENQCRHCSGSFALQFHSTEGTVEGYVTYDDGEPIWTTVHTADLPWFTPTDPNTGKYRFTEAAAPPENNWGLPVHRSGTSGPGTETYGIVPFGFLNEHIQTVTISSNSVAYADFQKPRNEVDPRCDPPGAGGSTPGPKADLDFDPAPAPGPACCTVGHPVSVTTGNVDLDQTDAVLPGLGLGLRFARSYNSNNSVDPERYGVFGPGWSHSYEKRLTFLSSTLIKLRESDGTPSYFQDADGNGVYLASQPFTKDSQITASGTLYTRQFRKGGQEVYDRQTPTGGSARLKSLTNAAGLTTTLSYDAQGQLRSIADPGGRQLTLEYVSGKLSTLSHRVGPSGAAHLIATFTYVGNVLQSVTYADGDGDGQPDGGYTFAYHAANGKLHTVTDRAGVVTETHEYDTAGRAVNTSVSNGVEAYTLDYTSQPNKTIVTDALGNATTYEWKKVWGQNRVVKITGPCAGCGSGGESRQWTYDRWGRVASFTDGAGDRTEYTYDVDGNLVTLDRGLSVYFDSLPHRTSYTYYLDGRVESQTAPNGAVTIWTYDPAGPHTITLDASNGEPRTTTIDYLNGKIQYVHDPLNALTELRYNALGDLDWVQDALLHKTSFQYDLLGRRVKTILPTTAPPNDSPTLSYDTLGRLMSVTNPNASFWRYTYDGGGRIADVRDPLDHHTGYDYDDYGRLETVTDALTHRTTYQYDPMSNLRFLTDARLKTTEFQYDGNNRLKKTVYPGPRQETFTYDAAGRIETRTDRKGVVTTFSYDTLGRPTGRSYSNGAPAVTFTYDQKGFIGFLTNASNAADQLAWTYNTLGEVLSEKSTRNATTIGYEYDGAGQRRKLTLDGSDLLTYAYEPDGSLNTITRATGVVFDFNVDAAHRPLTLAYPNATTAEYGYDLTSRLSSIRLKKGTTVLDDITYESNDADNRMARTQNGLRQDYGYDDVFRLTSVANTTDVGPTTITEQYSYDEVGNRLTALGVAGSWAYSDRNELLSYGGTNLTYDLNGNTESRSGGITYEWDPENRLQRVRQGGTMLASYEYDPLGRRVAKTASGATTLFAHDGEDVVRQTTGGQATTYLHGPGIDGPLATEFSNGRRFYLHADALGSIVASTNGQGGLNNVQAYNAFGAASPAPGNAYSFTGRQWDAESGSYHYRARHLDPITGRFLSQDPIGLLGGDINLYGYVGNRPTGFVDPYGLAGSSWWDWLPHGGGVAAGGSADVGVVVAGAGLNGSVGFGGFSGKCCGSHLGTFKSFGAMAGGPNWGWSLFGQNHLGLGPGDDGKIHGNGNTIGGMSAGLSIGPFLTNAKTLCDLAGPFNTWNFGVGNVGVQISWAGRTWQASMAKTHSWGAVGGGYPTSTAVKCDCQ